MAKEPRHKRMYKDSPKLERGEGGDMEVKKPSKEKGPTEAEKESDLVQSGMDNVAIQTDMDEIENTNYKTLKKKGFGDFESKYHASNPPGRLFPNDTPDPWMVAKEKADAKGDGNGEKMIKKVEEETAE